MGLTQRRCKMKWKLVIILALLPIITGCATTMTSAGAEDGSRLITLRVSFGGSWINGDSQDTGYSGQYLDENGQPVSWDMYASDIAEQVGSEAPKMEIIKLLLGSP